MSTGKQLELFRQNMDVITKNLRTNVALRREGAKRIERVPMYNNKSFEEQDFVYFVKLINDMDLFSDNQSYELIRYRINSSHQNFEDKDIPAALDLLQKFVNALNKYNLLTVPVSCTIDDDNGSFSMTTVLGGIITILGVTVMTLGKK